MMPALRSFFFNSWIYGAEIPSYAWKSNVEPAASGYKVSVTVTRRDTSDDFVAAVPIRVEFDQDRYGAFFVLAKEHEQTVTQNVPIKPRNVIFAPEHSLLANIRRE